MFEISTPIPSPTLENTEQYRRQKLEQSHQAVFKIMDVVEEIIKRDVHESRTTPGLKKTLRTTAEQSIKKWLKYVNEYNSRARHSLNHMDGNIDPRYRQLAIWSYQPPESVVDNFRDHIHFSALVNQEPADLYPLFTPLEAQWSRLGTFLGKLGFDIITRGNDHISVLKVLAKEINQQKITGTPLEAYSTGIDRRPRDSSFSVTEYVIATPTPGFSLAIGLSEHGFRPAGNPSDTLDGLAYITVVPSETFTIE